MKNIFIASMMLICFGLTSCSRFEEGPKITLRTIESRLTGDWEIVKFSVNDEDQTEEYLDLIGHNYRLEIEKDGEYRTEGDNPIKGSWELGADKDDIRFQPDEEGADEESYRILRLTNKEMWLRQTQSNGDLHVIEFEKE
ncbi:hypothetical protein GYB22_04920 [bacterium]|nr:hypothetical protein [bacterium]